MIGQAKRFSSHQQQVDSYMKAHEPSRMRTEIPFDLRGYLRYIDEHHITDPDEVPPEIVDSFFHPEEGEEKIPV